MKSDFLIALTQLAAERNLPREMVISAIEAALASAYKKDNVAAGQNIAVRLNPGTGDVRVFVLMSVADEVKDPRTEMTLAQAKKIKKEVAIGDTIEIESNPYIAGRIAAQTAKQVVMQRLREAERELVFEEYANRADEVVNGTVQRMESRQIIVNLGRAEGVLPDREQVPTERYRPDQRLKLYIVEVAKTAKGPEIILSRSHKNLLRRLFEIEVPEIYNGVVEIKAIAREAGFRSKVSVWARQEGVDAVGSCVGLRGIRIQNIVNELQGEKIDVVQWHRDPAIFIANALNPAQVLHVTLDEEGKSAGVVVQDRQLSLAIGKEGQNARLAAKLTGWKIDILSSAEAEAGRVKRAVPTAVVAEPLPKVAPIPVEGVALPSVAVGVMAKGKPAVAAAVAETAPLVAPAAAEPKPVVEEEVVQIPEPAAAIVTEEELAASPEQEEPEPTEEEAIPITEEVWKVPLLVPSATGSQIRFAEDFMVPRSAGGGRRARRGKGRDNATAKGKGAGRQGRGGYEER
ncbi:MAG: transcription termination/antitermination protein NusA [Chloroflexi bacterium]|nr:transcription termination/antitermination protein NusA [Chloroflexota bacterium]